MFLNVGFNKSSIIYHVFVIRCDDIVNIVLQDFIVHLCKNTNYRISDEVNKDEDKVMNKQSGNCISPEVQIICYRLLYKCIYKI